MTAGRFITLEGIDGAGKSTHIAWLAETISQQGHAVVVTREPGGTALGESLRELLLKTAMNVETEALLMFAARCEHLDQVIRPALERGDWVLCDRFSDASFAYQGAARGASWSKLLELERWVHGDVTPDLTLLFDVPSQAAKARLAGVREPDKFERQASDFFEAVRLGYRRRMAEDEKRFVLIDGTLTIEQIRDFIQLVINDFSKTDANKTAIS
jgi:dTMP kinase